MAVYEYEPTFLTKTEADDLLLALSKLDYKRGKTQYGVPRLHANISFADGFTERSHKADMHSLAEAPKAVRDFLAKAAAFTGIPLNHAGCMMYADGHDSIAYHQHKADHTGVRKDDQSVVLVSVGATRTWGMRPVGSKDTTKLQAKHGSFLYLHHECNITHEHAVLKTKNCEGVRYCVNAFYIPPKE